MKANYPTGAAPSSQDPFPTPEHTQDMFTDLESRVPQSFQESSTVSSENYYSEGLS